MQTDVPEGWERKPLGTVATIVGGTGFPTKHQGQTGAEFPFIKVSDMNLAGNERTGRNGPPSRNNHFPESWCRIAD